MTAAGGCDPLWYKDAMFQCVVVDAPSPYDSQVSGARTDTPFLP
jgi:hypothetical protein